MTHLEFNHRSALFLNEFKQATVPQERLGCLPSRAGVSAQVPIDWLLLWDIGLLKVRLIMLHAMHTRGVHGLQP